MLKNLNLLDPLYDVAKFGIQAGGWTGTVTLIVYLLYLITKVAGNPFEIKLRKHLATPDYEGRTAFIESFHQDFQRVLDAYVKRPSTNQPTELNKAKIYVFIDDLDRCELPKAAELINAINLLISDDYRLIFILGIDRQKIVAGLAFKYKDLLPFLSPNAAVLERQPDTSNESRSDSANKAKGEQSSTVNANLSFGYAFLEKFIQVPFHLPSPGKAELERFLEALSSPPRQTIKEDRKHQLSEPIDEDAPEAPYVRQIALWVADTFSSNPRRLKQFVNLFRLRLHIAHRTGKLEVLDGKRPALTPEQIGKLTAIILRWPNFIEAWFADQMLLAGLQLAALKPPLSGDGTDPWFGNLELRRLLRLDPKTGQESTNLSVEARLDEVDLDDMLGIAPAKLNPLSPRHAREEIARLIDKYQELRQTAQAGTGRTQRMNAIFWQMLKVIPDAQVEDAEVRRWFNGSEGERIAGLAFVQSTRSADLLNEVIDSIENQRTGYDQYRALRSAVLLESSLRKPELQCRLRQAIETAQTRGTISEEHPSRFDLAKQLLAELNS